MAMVLAGREGRKEFWNWFETNGNGRGRQEGRRERNFHCDATLTSHQQLRNENNTRAEPQQSDDSTHSRRNTTIRRLDTRATNQHTLCSSNIIEELLHRKRRHILEEEI